MSEVEKGLIVGYDYSEEYTFVSYYDTVTQEPVTIRTEGDTSFKLPTELGFEEIIKRILKIVPNSYIDKIMVTVKTPTKELYREIFNQLSKQHISKQKIFLQGHEESYLYYALSQSEELKRNNIGMFEFNEKGLYYYQIEIARNRIPSLVKLHKLEFTNILGEKAYNEIIHEQDMNKLSGYDQLFDEIVTEIFKKNIVSTVYFTGNGFSNSWCQKTLNKICRRQKAFIGQNLFTQGACYAAASKANKIDLSMYQFIGGDLLHYDIGIKAVSNGEETFVILKPAGTLWLEDSEPVDVILDDIFEIAVIIKNKITKSEIIEIIKLLEFPRRENKTTRLQLSIICNSVTNLDIIICDEGFGEMYSKSHLVWKKNIELLNDF